MSRRRLSLPLSCLIAAGITACGTAYNDRKVSAVQNPVTASANENAAATQPANAVTTPQVSPSESVQVRAAEISVRAGESAEAEIEVIVAGGYHINANPASEDYLRPTTLKIEPETKITFGKPIYLPAEMKKFDFAANPIRVYEGTVIIKLSVRTDNTAKIGRTVLRGRVQARACK